LSFKDCIRRGVSDGKVKQEKAQQAEIIYDAFYAKEKARGADDISADMSAGLEAMNHFTRITGEAKIKKLREMQKALEFSKEIEAMDVKDIPKYLKDFFDKKVDIAYETHLGTFHGIISGLINEYKPKLFAFGLDQLVPTHSVKWIPFKNKNDLDDIARALYGSKAKIAKNQAKSDAFAKMVNELTKTIVQHANRFGVGMQWDANFRLPQRRSRQKMSGRKAEFIRDHLEHLDWDIMTHVSGAKKGLPILPEERLQFLEGTGGDNLDGAFDIIITSGGYKKPGAGSASIADGMTFERSMYYKDAESWIKMNDKWGDGSVLTQIMGMIDGMARDLAIVDVLSPNHTAMKRYITDTAKNAAKRADKKLEAPVHEGAVDTAADIFESAYSVFANENAASYENGFELAVSTAKNVVSGLYLGSAPLVAVPSDVMMSVARSVLSKTSPYKFLKEWISVVSSSAYRAQAVRDGLIVDAAIGIGTTGARFDRDFGGSKWSRLFADSALRMSFLTPATHMAKAANKVSLLGGFTDSIGKEFDALEFKQILDAVGITKADWNIYRTTKIDSGNLFKVITPNDIRARVDIPKTLANDIADKFSNAIILETKSRVLEERIRGKVAWGRQMKKGTGIGSLVSIMTQFKSFPTAMYLQMLDTFADGKRRGGYTSALGYAATTFLALTFAGAVGLQLQQLRNGRDPLNIDPTTEEGLRFWGAAALKGGGGGFLGDFLFSHLNEYGRDASSYVTGPVLEEISDVLNLTVGNLIEIIQGKETHAQSEAVKFLFNHIPYSKTWFLALPLERMITDQLMMDFDPEARDRFIKREQKRMKEFGQEMWWRYGEEEPSRPPDMGAMVEE
jgi:hypothetical protein